MKQRLPLLLCLMCLVYIPASFANIHRSTRTLQGDPSLIVVNPDAPPPPDIWQASADAHPLTNYFEGNWDVYKAGTTVSVDWEFAWTHIDYFSWEVLGAIQRELNDTVTFFIGGDFGNGIAHNRAITGVQILFPHNFVLIPGIGSDGGYRLTLDETIYIGRKWVVWMELEYDRFTYWENQIRLTYKFNHNLGVSVAADSDYGVGVGFSLYL